MTSTHEILRERRGGGRCKLFGELSCLRSWKRADAPSARARTHCVKRELPAPRHPSKCSTSVNVATRGADDPHAFRWPHTEKRGGEGWELWISNETEHQDLLQVRLSLHPAAGRRRRTMRPTTGVSMAHVPKHSISSAGPQLRPRRKWCSTASSEADISGSTRYKSAPAAAPLSGRQSLCPEPARSITSYVVEKWVVPVLGSRANGGDPTRDEMWDRHVSRSSGTEFAGRRIITST